MAQTLYDKLWSQHEISYFEDGSSLIYIDRHLVHEVTSPQAFEGLALSNRPMWRRESVLAMVDHNVPTRDRDKPLEDEEARIQIETLYENVAKHGLCFFDLFSLSQGIVHIVGPEQGFTLPGTTIVCGDSHTATHGAFGALAFGIGTSEIEQVFAAQSLIQRKSKSMRVHVTGRLQAGVSAKDLILAIIAQIGIAGGTGYVMEFTGPVIESMSMESRMTLCNMAIEAGARSGLVAPDEITFAYLKDKPLAPKDALWDQAVAFWRTLKTDEGAVYDKTISIDASKLEPYVTWGTNPEMGGPISSFIPACKDASCARALDYMGLKEGMALEEIPIDQVFIGSCTNGRIEDLRQAAFIVKGRKIAVSLRRAMVVPGSGQVKKMAEDEGLDVIFKEAGFEWRMPGCSMCLAMNADRLEPLERCASTSNRNFEGRQGAGGRTHLMSPAMAGAAAIKGAITDVRKMI
ncbi:MAG: 3-isopropylmalate dehydratase large subunit [Alphaproteobacteria bacterium]|nr:3-isopropylmalate dehydratase large subunit [Alphaproteobacteria bacterium]